MFCKNCGAEMSDTARFCSKCGYDRMGEIQQNKKIIEDNVIRFQLKPTYSYSYKFLSALWNAILWIFLISVFFVRLPMLWIIYPSTFFITLAIVGIYIAIKMVVEKKQYDNLEYNFYATKVEYVDGFLNKEEKELKYKHIREVTMTQNILERLCAIGTIRIFTNASSVNYGNSAHNNMKGKNGIYIHCVKNVQEQYRIIKEIIDEGTPEE